MKNNKKVIIIGSILVIALLIGITYAYYMFGISQNGSNIVKTDCFEFKIEGKNEINLQNTIPMNDEESSELTPYEFTIKNKCSLAADYQLNIEVSNTSTLDTAYVRYSIDNDTAKTIGNQSEVTEYVNNNIKESRMLLTGTLQPKGSDTYNLRLWLDEASTVEQSANKTFSSKLVIKATMNNVSNNLIVMRNNATKLLEEKVNGPQSIGGEYIYDLSNTDITNATNISCNNDAKVTIEDNKLVINHITSDTICKINDSIKSTIDTLDDSKTHIQMIKNEDNVEKMTVASGKEVALDLNGKEINSIGVNETSTTYNDNHNVFKVNGKLTINDETGNGGVYTGTTCRAIDASTGGTIIINGGSYNGRHSVYISGSSSNVTINGGVFYSKLYPTINLSDSNRNSKLVINKGNFISDATNGCIIYTDSSVVNNDIEINGGTFTSTGATIFNNSGTININGGNFESTGNNTIYNANGTINICKATIKSGAKINNNGTGYIYYHTKAFGNVTPTFAGTTANIQVKDDVCN